MSCEYCEDEKSIIESNYRGVKVSIDDFEKTLDIAWYGESGWDAESIPITYCSMCGRKLGDYNDF